MLGLQNLGRLDGRRVLRELAQEIPHEFVSRLSTYLTWPVMVPELKTIVLDYHVIHAIIVYDVLLSEACLH